MFRRMLVVMAVLGSFLVPVLAPLPGLSGTGGVASAATDILGKACNGEGANSAACRGRTGQDPLTGPSGVLNTVTNIMAWIAGVAAVIFLVVGGIKYITAAGAPAEVQKAKETIIYALIGLIVIVLARAIITFVLGSIN